METQLPMLFMQNIFATCWIYVGSTRVCQSPGFPVFAGSRQGPGFPVFVGPRQGLGFPVFVGSRFSSFRRIPLGSRFSGFGRVLLGSWFSGFRRVPVFRFLQGPGSLFSGMPFLFLYFYKKGLLAYFLMYSYLRVIQTEALLSVEQINFKKALLLMNESLKRMLRIRFSL